MNTRLNELLDHLAVLQLRLIEATTRGEDASGIDPLVIATLDDIERACSGGFEARIRQFKEDNADGHY